MNPKYRIPITSITLFGVSSLLVITVGIALYLGFSQVAETTRMLWAGQSTTLINALEQSLDSRLRPVQDQARWMAAEINDLAELAKYDRFVVGSFAATPQVNGIAIIATDGRTRRWHRASKVAIAEDWSSKPWFEEYMDQVRNSAGPGWRDPIFTDTINRTTLLHDTPLRNAQGEVIGVLAQIIGIRNLSSLISNRFSDTGVTPFVLYNRDFVLAHPAVTSGSLEQPLDTLQTLGDLILERIWTPDEDASFISDALQDTEASGVIWGDDYYLFLHRDIDRYGPANWTIGMYLNTTLQTGFTVRQLFKSLSAGLVVMILAVFAAIMVGRRISTPIKSIVDAAQHVDHGNLDLIETLSGSRIRELDDATSAFNNMVRGLRERKLIRDTLGRYLPEKVATSLLASGGELEVQETQATILFCDIESFTALTESLGPVKIVKLLNAYFSAMVEILEAHGGIVTQFQGDAILATFNVPVTDSEHASKAVTAATKMLECVAQESFVGERLQIRIGINSGSVVAGAIGAHGRLSYTVHGDAVNLAARLESMNKEHGTRLLISEQSVALISGQAFEPVGELSVRGQSASIKVYTLASTFPAD